MNNKKTKKTKSKKNTENNDLSVTAVKPGIGIVLCGGGTKGAYEIGVWKALEEAGVFKDITGFSGSSIGAFNCALMADGDLAKAVRIWRDFHVFDFINLNKKMIAGKVLSGADKSAFHNLNENIAVGKALRKSMRKIRHFSINKSARYFSSYIRFVENLANPGKWKDLKPKHEISPEIMSYNRKPFRNFGIWFMLHTVGSGYATPDKLKKILDKNVELSPDRMKKIDIFSTICEWNMESNVSGRPVYINWKKMSRDQIIDLIGVSGALPVLYKEGNIRGKKYVDGGYADNEPVKPLYDAGYRKIFIVYLDKYKGFSLRHRIKAQEKAFPGCRFVRLIPNEEFNDSFAASCVLTPEMTKIRMSMGYKDCIKLIEHDKGWFK